MQPKQVLVLIFTLGVATEASVLHFGRSVQDAGNHLDQRADGKEAVAISTSPAKPSTAPATSSAGSRAAVSPLSTAATAAHTSVATAVGTPAAGHSPTAATSGDKSSGVVFPRTSPPVAEGHAPSSTRVPGLEIANSPADRSSSFGLPVGSASAPPHFEPSSEPGEPTRPTASASPIDIRGGGPGGPEMHSTSGVVGLPQPTESSHFHKRNPVAFETSTRPTRFETSSEPGELTRPTASASPIDIRGGGPGGPEMHSTSGVVGLPQPTETFHFQKRSPSGFETSTRPTPSGGEPEGPFPSTVGGHSVSSAGVQPERPSPSTVGGHPTVPAGGSGAAPTPSSGTSFKHDW